MARNRTIDAKIARLRTRLEALRTSDPLLVAIIKGILDLLDEDL